MRPRLLTTVLSSLLLLLTPALRAADVQWPAKIGKWMASSQVTSVSGFTSDPALAPIVKESGFIAGSSRIYQGVSQSVQLTLYTFHDSSGAYEACTAIKAMEGGPKSESTVLAKGNQVLWILGSAALSADDVKAAEVWVASVSDGVASPPVAGYLPDKGKEPATELYALGPAAFQGAAKWFDPYDAAGLVELVGFNNRAEAMFARYKNGANQATLLLIDYPTPQLAEVHLKHMERAIGAKHGNSVERKGSLLSIVMAPSSQEYAAKLRREVKYETQVTWNEASTTATDPPITSTLVKIIIATGVFMMVTIVVGIAFGGVRIITKRLFPGKVFDRKNQIEVLQLGLSSKPIDPSDMY